jgi:hypothetical protein
MRFRQLRIAWSVFWGLAAVLLIVLWVRSYWAGDSLVWNHGRRVAVASMHGQIRVATWNIFLPGGSLFQWLPVGTMSDGIGPWFFGTSREGILVIAPHRLPIAVLALFAAIPWIPCSNRFTLRTLLIATTVVAVVLGLEVYFSTKTPEPSEPPTTPPNNNPLWPTTPTIGR